MVKLNSTWYAMEVEEVLRALQSDLKGLSDEEVERRLLKFGYNELKKRKKGNSAADFFGSI
ncbi:MAG TPA: cation-transporting P-type ATPase [Candidatus Bathyarchaeia archaeon]|nr:cation-transporting P-type ATPase [Candidatus Bathyarchaeia archaeon]